MFEQYYLELFENQTGVGASAEFNMRMDNISRDFNPILTICGDIGTMEIELQFKDLNNVWQPTGDFIYEVGAYKAPINRSLTYRLYVNSGSGDISAVIYDSNGVLEEVL